MTPQQIADKMNEFLQEPWSDAYSLPALRKMAIRHLEDGYVVIGNDKFDPRDVAILGGDPSL